MNKCVLIVDDDIDFSQLLKGVFERADYTVHIAYEAEAGMRILETKPVQLVITDQRLVGSIPGSEFIRCFREKGVTLPVIMVSGYLNDDSIRDLIREGVEGVFIKPLNIFSLLKKASEIIERRAKGAAASQLAGLEGKGVQAIGQIEGLSAAGRAFLDKAREAATFQRNLLLIGPAGTLFEEIARDLVGLSGEPHRCAVIKPGEVQPERLAALPAGGEPVTLVVLETERLALAETELLTGLADERGAQGDLRMIFCLNESVEELFDRGAIDTDFYLFLGTHELRVPALREMPEDLLAIARRSLSEQGSEEVADMKLRALLLAHEWPGNMLELRTTLVRAVNFAHPLPPQTRHVEAALHPDKAAQFAAATPRSTLERFLRQERDRYTAATRLLCG